MNKLIAIMFFTIAFISGFLTWVSKNVWQDRERTKIFAIIGIIATIIFLCVVMVGE